MKILIALLLICGIMQAAELTFASAITVDPTRITHSSAVVDWTTTGGVLATRQVAFDTTAYFNANGSLRFKTAAYNTPFASHMNMVVSGLDANTSYTVCPSITDGTNTTVCTSAGNANSRATFTTAALPSTHPAVPTAPTTFSTTYPTTTATITLAADCGGSQSARDSTIASAYSATYTGQNVKVVMPSFATQTSTACNEYLNMAALTKSGGGTVVITSSAEGSGPAALTRTSPTQKNNSWMICTSGGYNVAALYPANNTRFVDLYIQPCDSQAASGDGHPQVVGQLVKFDDHVLQNLIFDRTNFDGRGYPYRVQFLATGVGNNVAFIDSYFNHAEIWQPWVGPTSLSISGNQIISAATFIAGRGDSTNSIAPFTVTQSSGTGTGRLYIKAAGAIEYRYSNGSASCASPCNAVLDATMTIPAAAVDLPWNGATSAISYTGGTFGAQTLPNNQLLSWFKEAGGTLRTNEWHSYGITSNAALSTNPTAKTWVIQNNYFGVTGFGVFPAGDSTPSGAGYVVDTSDWTIGGSGRGNEFQSNNSCLIAFGTLSASSSPYACVRRHHIETKNGYRTEISYNTFHDGFVAIGSNAAHAIDLKMDFIGSGFTRNSAVTDIWIHHNNLYNEPACFYIAGDINNSAQVPYWLMIQRVLIEQNICQSNAYDRGSTFIGATQGSIQNGAIQTEIEEETEDVIVRHNTFYQTTGSYGSILYLTDRWSEGLTYQNNIVYISAPYTFTRGITSQGNTWPVDSTPSFYTVSGSDGTSALNKAITPNSTTAWGASTQWSFIGNLIIGGCALSPNSQCVDATTAGSLVSDLSAQYPASNTWLATGDFGTRQNAVGWTNRASVPSGLYLLSTSTYHNAGTDGQDIGVYTAAPPVSGVSKSSSGRVTRGGKTR